MSNDYINELARLADQRWYAQQRGLQPLNPLKSSGYGDVGTASAVGQCLSNKCLPAETCEAPRAPTLKESLLANGFVADYDGNYRFEFGVKNKATINSADEAKLVIDTLKAQAKIVIGRFHKQMRDLAAALKPAKKVKVKKSRPTGK